MKDNEELIKWNKQSEKDLYKEASSTWDFNRYLCILKNGEFALATSICDEAPDGSVSCWFEFCDEELDEQYYVDDIEYWVLLEKPKGENKMTENQLSSNMSIQEDVLKLRADNEQLKAQFEKLLDFVAENYIEECDVCEETNTCINSEGVCPFAWSNRNLKDLIIKHINRS